MNRSLSALAFCFVFSVALGQETDRLRFSGYVDTYFSLFNDSTVTDFQHLQAVSPRHNTFGLNIAQATAEYQDSTIRGAATLHYGDIPLATWTPLLPNVQEANIGIALKHNLWLDAGLFTSHLGTESFLPKNNLLSSTTVATYIGPFYQTGIRMTYEKDSAFFAQLWILNGYNSLVDNNRAKSVGLVLGYQINKEIAVTYTNLLGNESETDTNQFLAYHNFTLDYQKDKWHVILGGDFATQSNASLDEENELGLMYNALLTLRRRFTKQFSTTIRAELYHDRNAIVSPLYQFDNDMFGTQLYGFTFGAEYKPRSNSFIRLEGRYLQAQQEIFYRDGKSQNDRAELMLTMGLILGEE